MSRFFSYADIRNSMPQRSPFLMLDRAEQIDDTHYQALKAVSINEAFFQGHFPNNPVMPGVLQIEAMAQTAGAIVTAKDDDYANKKVGVLFMSVDGVKFRKPVKPGDQLRMHVEKIKERRNIYVFKGQCMVDNQVVSEAEFSAMIVNQ